MTTYVRDAVLKDLRTLFDQGIFANLTDGELLERFVSRSGELSEYAFGILVERHGTMVLRVCGNVLKNPHDVEDAFQATFMILMRKAGSIRKRESCGSWLHGVALRAAAGIRTSTALCRPAWEVVNELCPSPVTNAAGADTSPGRRPTVSGSATFTTSTISADGSSRRSTGRRDASRNPA